MTIVDELQQIVDSSRKQVGNNVMYVCPWCPNIFCCKDDLKTHLLSFKITGVKPNEYDHKVKWKNLLEYRDKREPYENYL
jgi:hypothetical protein